MALLQISEPGQSTAPHQHRLSIGIDLGTTHSLVATVRSGLAEALADRHGRVLLPSVVRYHDDGQLTVGDSAKESAALDPLNTIVSVKRFMGRGITDVAKTGNRLPYEFIETDGGMPKIRTVAGDVSPVAVSAEILKALKARAEETLGSELTDAVITVPAYFDDAQRQATRDAATLAGLNTLRLLNEPTAAALAYGLDRGSEGVHAIYDLGGGTFDISILRFSRGVFEVLATAGDTALGGDDIDRVLAEWIMAQAGIADADHRLLRNAQRQACAAKEALSGSMAVDVALERADGSVWCGELRRDMFDALIEPLIKRTLIPCRRALKDAGISVEQVEDVVMVGGSTRVPLVRQRVGEFFRRDPLVDIDPDKVVAVGAAIQANILVGNKPDDELLLLDVLPLSLGIEIMGGLVEKIIPRNTPIPVAKAQEFTTFKDGQTAMGVHVVQGERELVDDCRSLARFELRGIPAMTAGAARIKVTYQVDADGLLSVSAREETQGVASAIQIKPSYGLGEGEIERMLRDSIEHAGDDIKARQLREQQVEADRCLEAIRAALAEDGDALLDAAERNTIDSAIEQLALARNGDDGKRIKTAIESLDRITQGYAAQRMNRSIRDALVGEKLESIDF